MFKLNSNCALVDLYARKFATPMIRKKTEEMLVDQTSTVKPN